MIGLDTILVTLQIYPEELLLLVTLHVKLIYGDGELDASSSSLLEEIICNEREMKCVMLAYFKYVTCYLH